MEPITLPNIELASAATAVTFAIVALVIAAICIFFPRQNSVSVKLLGSLMALSLAFAANHAAVYALAIFIIATLVTDLDFLEKIAALFWNRDKYWDYRVGTSSSSNVAAKVTSEAQEEAAAAIGEPANTSISESDDAQVSNPVELPEAPKAENGATVETGNGNESGDENRRARASAFKVSKLNLDYGVRLQGAVAKAWEFQIAAQQALAQFVASGDVVTIRRDAVISTPKGQVEVDAILETPTTDYLVEIKHSARPDVFLNLATQLKRAVDAYRGYLRREKVSKRIVPVAIVPASGARSIMVKNGFLVLRFDVETGSFVNLDQFRRAASNFETAF